jgi:hypothetical protein
LSLPFVSFWLRFIFKKREALAIDSYVVFFLAVTAAIWWWLPTWWWAVFCSYISASSVHALLSVVFLSKVFGDVVSPERSLILFICNVTQIVLMFSIWYEVGGLPKWEALYAALLVLGTLGVYREHEKVLVGIQIATDFLLLAIFLAHLVGRVGFVKKDTSRRMARRVYRKRKQIN